MSAFSVPGLVGKPTIFVDVLRVNIDDLLRAGSGWIVRCEGDPRECVMVMPSERLEWEFVAGLTSENP